MAAYVPRLVVVLLATFLTAVLGSSGSLDVRSPQAPDDDTTSLHFYTPTPSYTIPPWYTRTSSASTPTESVGFGFGDSSNTTVCGQHNITWSYTGSTAYTMGIAAMPVELSGSTDDNGSPTIITILNGGLGAGFYRWSPVRVPAGTYVLEVSIPNINTLYFSDPFWVVDSVDHSCLALSSSSTTSSGTPGTASATPGPASSSADGTSGIPAIGAVSDGPSLSSGGIAGVVIGGLTFVGALIAVLIFLWHRRANRAVGAPRGGLFEKRRPKGAVAIGSRGGSFSSAHGRLARGMGSSAFGLAPHYSFNDPSQSDVGHVFLDEDVRSTSVTGEKPITHTPVEFGVIPPAVVHRSAHTYRDSFGSIASGSTTAAGSPVVATNHYRASSKDWAAQNVSDPFSSGPPTPSPRASGDYPGPSGGQRQVPVALFSPSSAVSTPRSYGSPGVPRDISIASYSSPDLTYEPEVASPSAVVTAPAVSRRAPPEPPTAVPTSSQQSRRGKSASSRKPVPVYEPSISGEALELVEPSTPRSTTGSTGPYDGNNAGGHQSRGSLGQSSSVGNDWSSAAAHSHSPPSGGSHMSSGSYLYDAGRHSLSGAAGRGDMPDLNHKSSFGDRQMHVLIPDPPTQEMR